jgi:YggT family protein
MLLAIFNIADLLLRVLGWVIIAQVILSLLVAFNVLNTSSQGLRSFLEGLDRFTAPLYRPIRKIMPDFGGLDFSPMVVLILIQILRMLLSGLATDIAYATV